MPVCIKCKNKFPNRIKIGNKYKNICNRKYCLECSPFGEHNTKQIHKVIKLDDPELLTCNCGRQYLFDEKKGHSRKRCNSCNANKNRAAKKLKAVEYKGGKCCICGYNKCLDALSFHHLNPEEKDFSLSGNFTFSWERLKNELDKCILVCCRCHFEIHANILSLDN